MVFNCSACGKPVMKVYNSDDGELKDVCANCKAKYEHEQKVTELKSQEPNELDKINKRIDKMAKMFKFNQDRFEEIEKKNGDLEKRIEVLESISENKE